VLGSICCALALFLAASAAGAGDGELRLTGAAVEEGAAPTSAGGAFTLVAEAPPPPAPHGDDFVVTQVGPPRTADLGPCGCLFVLFADGFESGDTAEWSGDTP
jgi:hypothetical protein